MEYLETREGAGVIERQFVSARGDRQVPGVLWLPPGGIRGPVVLLGHGGSGSAFDDYIVALARGLVRDAGCACVAIDGPVHGRRRGKRSQDSGLVLLDFSQAWAADDSMTDEMVADWRLVLDELIGELGLEGRPVGYWGLSMGTILGLPLVAAEPRIAAAVLGLCGRTGPTGERLGRDAAAICCPVFFLQQLDDELFSRESSLALFDALGCADRQLHATPGRHGEVTAESFRLSAAFLLDRLAP
jgi:pimeloyl-ACP methyl ester carboxylesterase